DAGAPVGDDTPLPAAPRRRSAHRARGADQSAAPLQLDDDGGNPMNDTHAGPRHATLIELLEANRGVDRTITYIEGESSERTIAYGDVHARALGILNRLQSLGAQRGDKMIIFLSNNEQFIDGFWAAIAGGIVPVPLAVGISDEHRHKLLRVARKLGAAWLYTDSKNLERLRALAAEAAEMPLFESLKQRTFLVESITDISRP